jgi:hypothetical protein
VKVVVHDPTRSFSVVESIERDALKQKPMTVDQIALFNELRSYEFFVPFREISRPEKGNGVIPNIWNVGIKYAHIDSLFSNVDKNAPMWIRDVASVPDMDLKIKKYNFYTWKWFQLYRNAQETDSDYHLCKMIHDLVTCNGTKPIKDYHAPTSMEVLEAVLPEKYKTDKKAS